MKTRLYYSFMVGTALAMGNMRPNPESQNRPAIVTVLDSKSPLPAVGAAAEAHRDHPLPQQGAPATDAQGGIILTA